MSQFDVSNRLYAVLWSFVVLILGFAVIATLNYWTTSHGNYPREISVEGNGSAFVVPDTAKISFGVYSKGPTVEEVIADNTKRINQVMAVLKEKGVDEKDIQTTDYNLNQNYKWTEKDGSVQDGYYLSQNIQLTLKDFDIVGDLISSVTEVGVDMVGGVQFVVGNTDAAKEDARKEAIANAKAKAEDIAKASGLKLGKVINYWEYENNDGYNPIAYAESSVKGMGGGGLELASPEISPGQKEVKLNVNLTYRLK